MIWSRSTSGDFGKLISKSLARVKKGDEILTWILTSKHLVFPQPGGSEVRPQPWYLSVLWGSFTSVWWLQKVWKPQPPRRVGRPPLEGGRALTCRPGTSRIPVPSLAFLCRLARLATPQHEFRKWIRSAARDGIRCGRAGIRCWLARGGRGRGGSHAAGRQTGAAGSGLRGGRDCRAAHRCAPWPVAARAAPHSAAPRTGLFEETRDILIARVPCISTSRPLACGSFGGSPTTPCWPRLVSGLCRVVPRRRHT